LTLSNDIEDNVLAQRIRNDDSEAFTVLFTRYRKILYYFSLKYLHDPADAEGLVQIIFISLWEHRKSLDEKKSLKAYLYKIAVNNIYNNLKKKALRRKYIIDELKKPERSVNPYPQIFYSDLDDKIELLVTTLPPQQQKIFNFRRFEGLSYEEIAVKLSLSVRTVENQIYRVTKLLKHKLDTEGYS
jgi:RNA polymerase sigma-70 factor, ECF subfamily